jgi:hypothetical protein
MQIEEIQIEDHGEENPNGRIVSQCILCGKVHTIGRYSIQSSTHIVVGHGNLQCCNIGVYVPRVFDSMLRARAHMAWDFSNPHSPDRDRLVDKACVDTAYLDVSYFPHLLKQQ